MNEAFLQRLRPTLYICRLVGCVQFSLENNPNLRDKARALIFPLSYQVLGLYCIIMTCGHLQIILDSFKASELVQVTNLMSIISVSITFILRSAYYFCARKHIRNIILQVGIHAITADQDARKTLFYIKIICFYILKPMIFISDFIFNTKYRLEIYNQQHHISAAAHP